MNSENTDQQAYSNDELGDIMNTLATVRDAFRRVRLEPPAVLVLESRDEGMRFLSAVRKHKNWYAMISPTPLGAPVKTADDSMWMELEAMGMKIRWPANCIITPDGRRIYI